MYRSEESAAASTHVLSATSARLTPQIYTLCAVQKVRHTSQAVQLKSDCLHYGDLKGAL